LDAVSIRERGIGEILDGAFRLYRQDVGLYVLTAVLAAIPAGVFGVLSISSTTSDVAAALAFLLFVPALMGYVVAWGAIMHQMNERLGGREPGFGSGVRRGFRLFFRVLWGGILAYLVIVLAMGAVGVGAVLLGGIAATVLGGVATGIVTAVAGLAFALTLGVRAFSGAMLFLPGIVTEGRTGYASLARGFELTRKGSLRIAAVLALSWILVFVPMMAVYVISGTTQQFLDPDAIANGTIGMGRLAVQQLLVVVSSGVTTPFQVACVLLLHYDQRVRLEAFDLEAEARELAL